MNDKPNETDRSTYLSIQTFWGQVSQYSKNFPTEAAEQASEKANEWIDTVENVKKIHSHTSETLFHGDYATCIITLNIEQYSLEDE